MVARNARMYALVASSKVNIPGVHFVLMKRCVMRCFSPSARVRAERVRGCHELNSAELVDKGRLVASSRNVRSRFIAASLLMLDFHSTPIAPAAKVVESPYDTV